MTTPTRASSQRHFDIYVSVNGRDLGPFDTKSGGEPTSEASKFASGTSPDKRATLGGPADVSDVTVMREYHYTRDLEETRLLRPLVGKASVTVSVQPLDADLRPYGRPDIFTGVLSGVTPVEVDKDSGDRAMWGLTMQVDGAAG